MADFYRNRTLWVFRTDSDFGYVIVEGESPSSKITARVSHGRIPWLAECRTVGQLESELRARYTSPFGEAHGGGWRLYRPAASDAPMCFPTFLSWLWFLDDGVRGRRDPALNYCAQCTRDYQAKMIGLGRCGFPHRDPEAERAAEEAAQERRSRQAKRGPRRKYRPIVVPAPNEAAYAEDPHDFRP